MAIVNVRIDERLIHGQVAMVWTNTLGCNRIIVANDKAVKDEMQINALKLSKPTGVKLSILSLNKAVININAGKYDEDKVFLICRNIQDCRTIIDNGLKLDKVNVGNISHRDGSKKIKKSVSLSEKDIEDINYLINKGIEVTAQMLPDESNESILKFL